jgi:hypothetical protein
MENSKKEVGLVIGETTVKMIVARNIWNDTHILMKKGESYNFESSGYWQDLANICDANGYASNNFLLRSTEWLRRFPSANWFALIGAINHSQQSFFKIGHQATITIEQEGLFSCYANDLSFMYGNNSGEIELTITRLA